MAWTAPDKHGVMVHVPDVPDGMMTPVICTRCRSVFDLSTVTVTARHADASYFATPCCNMPAAERAGPNDGYIPYPKVTK